jgi:hypothetical protein
MGYCSDQIPCTRRSRCQSGLSVAKALGYTVLSGDRLRLRMIYFGFSVIGFAAINLHLRPIASGWLTSLARHRQF